MAALGAVGVSVRAGVPGTGVIPAVPTGFLNSQARGAVGHSSGLADPTPTTAISRVQSKGERTTAVAASLSAVFDAPPTSGNLLIAAASSDATLTMTSTGWTLVASVIRSTGHYLWIKTAGASESSTVTVTPSVSVTTELYIEELSGTTAADLDEFATSDPGVHSATIASGTTGTTAQADEYVIASYSWNEAGGSGNVSLSSVANSGQPVAPKFAKLASLQGTDPSAMDTGLGVAGRFLEAVAAVSQVATLSSSGGHPTGIIATFKAAGVGGGPIEAAIGIALTTDSALVVARVSITVSSSTSDTSTAQVIGRSTVQTVGTASDSSLSQTIASIQYKTVPIASELDTLQIVTKTKYKSIDISSDNSDSNTIVTPGKIINAIESNIAIPLSKSSITTVNTPSEINSGLAILSSHTRQIELVQDFSTSSIIGSLRYTSIIQSVTQDSAFVVVDLSDVLGTAYETDMAMIVIRRAVTRITLSSSHHIQFGMGSDHRILVGMDSSHG